MISFGMGYRYAEPLPSQEPKPEPKPKEYAATRKAAFAVGDIVSTDFTGGYGGLDSKRTTHRVVAVKDAVSQTGVVYRVSPPVPKSGGPMSWLDEAWFQLVRKAGT